MSKKSSSLLGSNNQLYSNNYALSSNNNNNYGGNSKLQSNTISGYHQQNNTDGENNKDNIMYKQLFDEEFILNIDYHSDKIFDFNKYKENVVNIMEIFREDIINLRSNLNHLVFLYDKHMHYDMNDITNELVALIQARLDLIISKSSTDIKNMNEDYISNKLLEKLHLIELRKSIQIKLEEIEPDIKNFFNEEDYYRRTSFLINDFSQAIDKIFKLYDILDNESSLMTYIKIDNHALYMQVFNENEHLIYDKILMLNSKLIDERIKTDKFYRTLSTVTDSKDRLLFRINEIIKNTPENYIIKSIDSFTKTLLLREKYNLNQDIVTTFQRILPQGLQLIKDVETFKKETLAELTTLKEQLYGLEKSNKTYYNVSSGKYNPDYISSMTYSLSNVDIIIDIEKLFFIVHDITSRMKNLLERLQKFKELEKKSLNQSIENALQLILTELKKQESEKGLTEKIIEGLFENLQKIIDHDKETKQKLGEEKKKIEEDRKALGDYFKNPIEDRIPENGPRDYNNRHNAAYNTKDLGPSRSGSGSPKGTQTLKNKAEDITRNFNVFQDRKNESSAAVSSKPATNDNYTSQQTKPVSSITTTSKVETFKEEKKTEPITKYPSSIATQNTEKITLTNKVEEKKPEIKPSPIINSAKPDPFKISTTNETKVAIEEKKSPQFSDDDILEDLGYNPTKKATTTITNTVETKKLTPINPPAIENKSKPQNDFFDDDDYDFDDDKSKNKDSKPAFITSTTTTTTTTVKNPPASITSANNNNNLTKQMPPITNNKNDIEEDYLVEDFDSSSPEKDLKKPTKPITNEVSKTPTVNNSAITNISASKPPLKYQTKEIIEMELMIDLSADYITKKAAIFEKGFNEKECDSLDTMLLLFQDLVYQGRAFIFDFMETNEIVKNFGIDPKNFKASKISKDTIKKLSESFNQYVISVTQQESKLTSKTRYFIPLKSTHRQVPKLVEIDCQNESFNCIFLVKAPSDKETQNFLSELMQYLKDILKNLYEPSDIKQLEATKLNIIGLDNTAIEICKQFEKSAYIPFMLILYHLLYESNKITKTLKNIDFDEEIWNRFTSTLTSLFFLSQLNQTKSWESYTGYFYKFIEDNKDNSELAIVFKSHDESTGSKPNIETYLKEIVNNITKGVRETFYCLEIIQQPLRSVYFMYVCITDEPNSKPIFNIYQFTINDEDYDKQIIDAANKLNNKSQYEVVIYKDYPRHQFLYESCELSLAAWVLTCLQYQMDAHHAFALLVYNMNAYHLDFGGDEDEGELMGNEQEGKGVAGILGGQDDDDEDYGNEEFDMDKEELPIEEIDDF